jgi:hypothetical protein
VKPVTTSEIETVCGLPCTAASPFPLAEIVIVPVYWPGDNAVASELIRIELPFPVSVPEVVGKTSQLALLASSVAVHDTGRAHLPASLNLSSCPADDVCPWGTDNDSEEDESCNVQRCNTVTTSAMVCGLPCTGMEEPVTAIVSCVV